MPSQHGSASPGSLVGDTAGTCGRVPAPSRRSEAPRSTERSRRRSPVVRICKTSASDELMMMSRVLRALQDSGSVGCDGRAPPVRCQASYRRVPRPGSRSDWPSQKSLLARFWLGRAHLMGWGHSLQCYRTLDSQQPTRPCRALAMQQVSAGMRAWWASTALD